MKGIIHIFMQSAHKNQFACQTIFQTDSDSPGGSGEAAPKENQGADQENQESRARSTRKRHTGMAPGGGFGTGIYV
jgi:amino acid permease